MSDDGMDEIIEEFLAECGEILSSVEEILVHAETAGMTDENIAAVFRGIHTVKGTAAFLDFGHMSSVAHDAEHLLSRVRDKSLELTKPRVDLLLEAVDVLRAMLGEVEATGRDGENEYEDLVAALVRAAEAGFEESAPSSDAATIENEQVAEPSVSAVESDENAATETEHRDEVLDEHDDEPSVEADLTHDLAHTEPRPSAVPGLTPETTRASAPKAAAKTDSEQVSIRVDTLVLDRLIDLVGELVLARNQLMASGVELGTAGQRLNHVVTELQEGIMRTRMQPVATLLAKAPRIARDAANQLQKRVRVVVDAGDTELDRGVLEAVRDPLTHLLRNAVDHGIERPAERIEAGKDAEGVVDVRAWHEGGHVVVEVRDNGRGIDVERVKARAVERGLLDPSRSATITEAEARQLLLLPGFSTAEQVTAVSGRGVGMDVVKSNVERIGGSVEVESELGVGTAWRLRIPLTLAILPVLVVRVGSYRLAIPSSALREALRVESDQVERFGERQVLRLRGEMLPLVHLTGVLGEDVEEESEALRVIVVSDGQTRVGLVVSEIGDPAEIVVKPLGTLLGSVATIAGATVMGDGRIAYILDIAHIAHSTGLDGFAGGAQTSGETEDLLDAGADVIVGRRGHARIAFEVGLVERLERFPLNSFEHSGGRCVVQYRDSLLSVENYCDSGYVVVCRRPDGTLFGVGVDEVEDVADIGVEEDGTVVVAGKVAERYVLSGRWS